MTWRQHRQVLGGQSDRRERLRRRKSETCRRAWQRVRAPAAAADDPLIGKYSSTFRPARSKTEKTGVSDVPKTFWNTGVARGKSTTTAKHVRDPTGQLRF